MIRVDAVWLAVQPLDMRLGTEAALASARAGARTQARLITIIVVGVLALFAVGALVVAALSMPRQTR